MSDTETPLRQAIRMMRDDVAIHQAIGMMRDGIADAYERQLVCEYIKQLEAALENEQAKLALVDQYSIYVADQIAAVPNGTACYSLFRKWLEEKEGQL